MVIFAELLAGLGLLFVGLKLLSTHLQQATGRRVRQLLRAATRSRLAGFLSGAAAGAATQSSNAVAVIAGNLVRGGVFSTRDAIGVVAGANVGTSLLVFVAAFDFRVAVLYLVALAGFAFHFRLDRRPAFREWMGVLLGLALIFLGLDYVKTAPRQLDVSQLVGFFDAGISPLVTFAIGFAVALVTQSSSTAAILALAAVKSGMLPLEEAFYVVVGANLGSGFATLVSAGGLTGTGRQLCYVHILVKAVGSVLLVAGFEAIRALGGDPVAALMGLCNHSVTTVVSVVFLVLQLAGAVPVAAFRGLTERIAVALSPPSTEDSAAKPHFIDERALGDPATALDLSAREAGRLVALLPELLPDLDQPGAHLRERSALWRGSTQVASALDAFLVELIARGPAREDLDVALHQQALAEMVRALQDTLHEFSEAVDGFAEVPPLAFRLSESLRTIVMSLAEALGGTREDFDILIALTADRSELLDRIRRAFASELGADEDARRLLLATSLFERAIWLVRRLSVTLRPAGNGANPG